MPRSTFQTKMPDFFRFLKISHHKTPDCIVLYRKLTSSSRSRQAGQPVPPCSCRALFYSKNIFFFEGQWIFSEIKAAKIGLVRSDGRRHVAGKIFKGKVNSFRHQKIKGNKSSFGMASHTHNNPVLNWSRAFRLKIAFILLKHGKCRQQLNASSGMGCPKKIIRI